MNTRQRSLLIAWLALAACEPKGAATDATRPTPTRRAVLPSNEEPATEITLPAGARVVDLTYSLNAEALCGKTAPQRFTLASIHQGESAKGVDFAANLLVAPERGGTHIDAPAHFAAGKPTTDTIPLERLVAPAVVIDISERANKEPDTLLTTEDIQVFEANHGEIKPGTITLIRTGWGARWPDRARYLGDDTPGDANNLHFPGVAEEAAKTLVKRKIAAIGIDTASIDHGPSRQFLAHRALLAANIPAFENVASLERVPLTGAIVVALPMKIDGGSSGPLRIIAVVPARSGTGG